MGHGRPGRISKIVAKSSSPVSLNTALTRSPAFASLLRDTEFFSQSLRLLGKIRAVFSGLVPKPYKYYKAFFGVGIGD